MDKKFVEGVLRHALTNRDLAHIELQDLDVEVQLPAIKNLIRRNQQADEDLEQKIRALYEQARRTNEVRNGPYQDDRWVDETYQLFFQYAAHSMAAVGMLVPFIEALFAKLFRCECLRNKATIEQPVPNDKRASAWESAFWNPRFVFDKRGRCSEDIGRGIIQLASYTRLAQLFPKDYDKTVEALFLYRNKMFHNGFIWPENERTNFKTTIKERRWPENWFVETSFEDSAKKTEQPWIFCMSTEFTEHCLQTIEQVLDGYGNSLRTASEK